MPFEVKICLMESNYKKSGHWSLVKSCLQHSHKNICSYDYVYNKPYSHNEEFKPLVNNELKWSDTHQNVSEQFRMLSIEC